MEHSLNDENHLIDKCRSILKTKCEDAYDKLRTINKLRATEIEAYFEQINKQLRVMAAQNSMITNMQLFRRAFEDLKDVEPGAVVDQSPAGGVVDRWGSRIVCALRRYCECGRYEN